MYEKELLFDFDPISCAANPCIFLNSYTSFKSVSIPITMEIDHKIFLMQIPMENDHKEKSKVFLKHL